MRIVIPLFALVILGCTGDRSGATTASTPEVRYRPHWAQLIADSNCTGVFVLWEPDSSRFEVSDTTRVQQGFLPASTFKIFNALVALQTGVVTDEHAVIPWDGVVRRPQWDSDMDMRTAMEVSCVPWYQEVARRAGKVRMQHWLDTVHYGNAVMGDSIDLFWLQGGLRITPVQQVFFLQQLNEERLPFDRVHQRTVKRILPSDSAATWHIRGKTGWAIRVDEEYGWYVGWVERAGRTAYFALNIDMENESDIRKRQTITRALLIKEGWLDNNAR